MIQGHGDDTFRYQELLKMNFSSTCYQHADHEALRQYMADHMDVIANYPEPQPKELERLIAQRHGVSPESVMVTNGATEAIYLIAKLLHDSCSIIPGPTYMEYADACRAYKHFITYENTGEIADMPKDRVYWICNPNNPSGNVLMKGFVEYVVRRSPRYTFVVDQSYGTFTRGGLLEAHYVQAQTNLFILHSLSRLYSVPGLRVGYILAHPVNIQMLRAQRHPWAVPALSIEAATFLLKEGKPAVDDVDAYLVETERLRSALRKIKGLRVFETKTNYMLCELSNVRAAELKHYLIHEHGILIRDCSNFYGLSDYFFRVTAQLPEENDALVAAISEYLSNAERTAV